MRVWTDRQSIVCSFTVTPKIADNGAACDLNQATAFRLSFTTDCHEVSTLNP